MKVGLIGTGSSGVQVVTALAGHAKELLVFQRTPSYVIPSRNKVLAEDEAAEIKSQYKQFRAEAKQTPNGHHPGPYGFGKRKAADVSEAEHAAEYERRWEHGGLSFLTGFTDLASDARANATAAEFVRSKIRGLVKDPGVATLLCPQYPIGAKRLCVASGYYEAFNEDTVKLIDASEGIDEVTASSVRVGGREHEVDCLILATGYDAFTGAVLQMEVQGKDGLRLHDKWAKAPCTYLGLALAGFPNLFMVTGPGSPSVLTNMVPSIEQHVNFIAGCLERARQEGKNLVEAEQEAEDAWWAHHSSLSSSFLRSSVNNWWNGGNIKGKPKAPMPYMGGFASYAKKCEEVVEKGYAGFRMTSAGACVRPRDHEPNPTRPTT
eukprot:TRINITY_DN43211_c0_g1_i3.p1 TRINITY_DN43211_c0_g1~~TRINITY_DN43211_c0_g1_i3.p1  ORF type:complete len:378 (+),score=64.15 TRINITY_DN43211_c0_g1_i3:377-1510(+)